MNENSGNDHMTELSRKEKERAAHRQLILETAEDVFARKGYHNATVQEIAEQAEFSVGFLYNIFEGKEDIFEELVCLRASQFLSDVEGRLEDEADPVDRVRAAIAAKIEFFRQHQRFFLIYASLATAGRGEALPRMPEECSRRYSAYVDRLAGIIREGVACGAFRDLDPMSLAVFMEGMTNATIAVWVHRGGRDVAPATPELVQTVFLEGVMAREASR
jgi:AcrR family transcriptional regulator